jgi:hypothetical protein
MLLLDYLAILSNLNCATCSYCKHRATLVYIVPIVNKEQPLSILFLKQTKSNLDLYWVHQYCSFFPCFWLSISSISELNQALLMGSLSPNPKCAMTWLFKMIQLVQILRDISHIMFSETSIFLLVVLVRVQLQLAEWCNCSFWTRGICTQVSAVCQNKLLHLLLSWL